MPTPLENCRVLQQALNAFNPRHLDLARYRAVEEDCGTLYCLFGLAGTLPHFIAQGLYFNEHDNLMFIDTWADHRRPEVETIFGVGAGDLFASWGCGYEGQEEHYPDFPAKYDEDEHLCYEGRAIDDYTLATLRLQYHIERLENGTA